MAFVNWVPPDITNICAETAAPLTQCSPTGFMFLTLVARLFGGSVENQISLPKINPYLKNPHGLTSNVFDVPEKSDSEDIHIPQLGPNLITSDIKVRPPVTELGPFLEPNVYPINQKLNNLAQEYPEIHSYTEHYSRPDFEFEYESFANPFTKYFSRNPNFNHHGEERSYADSDAADSRKVTVKFKKSNKKSSRRKKRQTQDEYDFIIVGAGSAGCVIANRLSEVKKWKILLLEAGPEEPEVTSVPGLAPTLGRSSIDWMYRTQPEELTCRAQRGQTCAWLSGRVMGGSSAINYLVYMRGNKKDYDDWAALGNRGWSFREVLPYFIKSENNRNIKAVDKRFHGKGGPLTVEKFKVIDKNVHMLFAAFNESGLPIVDSNGEQQLGTMITQTTSENGIRVSTNTAFVRPVRTKRQNLYIKTNAQVIKILIKLRSDVLIANGVKYLRNGVIKKAFAKKEIIISAGALNSPKILLLSGVGPKSDLQKLGIPVHMNLKVGYNLQDHVTTDAFLMRLSKKTSTLIKDVQMLKEVLNFNKLTQKHGLLAATGPLQITAFIRTKYADVDKTVPDIQFHFDGRNLNDFYANPSHYLATNVLPLSFYDSINVRPILLLPKSRGFITLNKTDPIFGQPLIYPNFFTNENDVNTLIEALQYIIKLENTRAFKENQVKFVRKPVKACENLEWGTNDYLFCILTRYTATIFHPAGTCKMGPKNDRNAVVDNKLKIYGFENLRVADASIMPNIIRGNTNAAVIMIGEKVSDIIKEIW